MLVPLIPNTPAIAYSGTVSWTGDGKSSVILCDDIVLEVTNGSNSTISYIQFENIIQSDPDTYPWIITRDVTSWGISPTPVQSNGLGYQPTGSDIGTAPGQISNISTDPWYDLTIRDVGPS